jgi:RNA polymerase sigma-70 factor (ECF subfamily)
MHATAAAPTCPGDSFERDAVPYMPKLYPAALRLTGDRGHAEDLIQETFTRAYVKFHQFTPGTNLRAWLYRIMYSTFYTSCRDSGRRPVEVLTDERGASRGRALAAAVSSAEAEALGNLGDSGIVRALADLPARYKTVIYLADVEGYQCNEIAGMLRIPIGTVMSRIYRGRAMLRAKVAPPRQVTSPRTVTSPRQVASPRTHPPALPAPDSQDVSRLAA